MTTVEELCDKRVIAALQQRYRFGPDKSLGQNFLVDPDIPRGIADSVGAGEGDAVVEIGPGLGVLTAALADTGAKVLALELDRNLLPVLERTVGDRENVTVVQGDALKTDFQALFAEHFGSRRVFLCSNVPYCITSRLLTHLLEADLPVCSMTLMVQKEAAERVATAPGGEGYGPLSLLAAEKCAIETVMDVPPESFFPRPKVDSRVLRLTPHAVPPVAPKDVELFRRLIRAAFLERRKTLVNTASRAGFGKDDLRAALAAASLPETVRGEALSLEQFALLADRLAEQ